MIRLRPACAGEGQALYDVTRDAILVLAAGHYEPAQIANWMNGRDAGFYERVIAEEAVCVAELGGVVAGFVTTAPGWIVRLFVRPEFAGRGVGRLLLAFGVTAAGQNGEVRLEATLNAVPFYARCGFVALERVLHVPKLGGLPVEVVNMVWRAGA